MNTLFEPEQLQQNQSIVENKKYRDVLPEGYTLHWYEIQSVLGRGGYGITYLANDKNLDRKIAIKEYLPLDFAARQTDQTVHPLTGEKTELYQWGLDRFLKEARTLAKFSHPNIVRVLSVFEHNNTAYMIMDYEEGEELAAVIKNTESFTEEELLDIFIPVMDGLSLVHESGFIHRDIKPSNIYIREDKSPVLLDFGSARQSSGTTRTLTSMVTYGYAPFEQYNEGHDKQGPWTDIYGLGASLYYAITKCKPEDALKRGGAILAGANDPYEPISIIAKGKYSDNFLRAIDNAMLFRAPDRPQDILTWADMLLGKEEAPALPEEMLLASAPPEGADRTVIMPPEYYEQRDTGRSKPPTGRLIDASGRRSAVSQPPTQPPTGAAKAADITDAFSYLDQKYQQPPQQPVTPPPRPHEPKHPPSHAPAQVTKPPKAQNKTIWALMALIGVLAFGAIIIVFMPEKKEAETQTTAKQEPVRQKETVADEKTQRINELLQLAQTDFNAGRLVKPEQENAAFRYLKVLEIDPGNKQASQGIDKIIQHYADLAKQNLRDDDVLAAHANVQIIESLSPRSPVAMEMRLKLQSAKDQSKHLASLLTEAKQAFNQNRITLPEGDNALEKYQRALRIDPLNQEAKQGLQTIFSHFANLAEDYIDSGRSRQAEETLDKMDLIEPNSRVTRGLRQQLSKLSDTQSQIAGLLKRGDSAYSAGRYTEPQSTSAIHYYRQALKQDPGNKRATVGINKITDYYKRQFDKTIAAADFDNAEKVIDKLRLIDANGALTVAAIKELQQKQTPPKPEIEIISDLVGEFKKNMESYNTKKLKTMSEFSAGREQFVDQFFGNYQSFKVKISAFKYIAREHKATAKVTLNNLVNKSGHPVKPGAWGQFDISVQKNKSNQWRVYW